MSKLVCIKTFGERVEAELAKSILAANGITASVSANDVGGVPTLTTGGAKLLVLEDNAQEALAVLEKKDG